MFFILIIFWLWSLWSVSAIINVIENESKRKNSEGATYLKQCDNYMWFCHRCFPEGSIYYNWLRSKKEMNVHQHGPVGININMNLVIFGFILLLVIEWNVVTFDDTILRKDTLIKDKLTTL